MEREQALQIFRETGALLEGHFLLSSGLHSPMYFQCALVLQHPRYAELFCSEIAKHFASSGIQAVAAPAIGGIVVAQEVARLLGVRGFWAERQNGVMTLRRGFNVVRGERVLVVEDVVTTGGSVKEVVSLIRALGAHVVGVGAIVDRSGGRATFDVDFFATFSMNAITYEPQNCPLCEKGLPLVKPGSRQVKF